MATPNNPPLDVEYREASDMWRFTVKDENGKGVLTFKYYPNAKSRSKRKTSGVTLGAYKPAEEGNKSSGVVSPKTPREMEAEADRDWQTKSLIHQATHPEERGA